MILKLSYPISMEQYNPLFYPCTNKIFESNHLNLIILDLNLIIFDIGYFYDLYFDGYDINKLDDLFLLL